MSRKIARWNQINFTTRALYWRLSERCIPRGRHASSESLRLKIEF